jgi:hypothetical protein
MANATPSRLGQIAGAGATDALFLKVWSGEVMTVFYDNCVMKDKTRVRNLSSGKSAQFPAIAGNVAAYHTPGAEITGTAVQHDEKIVTIDDMLLSSAFIANIDEAKNHYEVRSEYARGCGEALAQTYDRNLFSLAVKAARDAAGIGAGAVGQGDASSVAIGATPTVQQIIDAIYDAAQTMDEGNIPASDRYVFVSPATYWGLVTNDKILNRDFTGGNGAYEDGNVINVAGMKIVKTNNLAQDHTTTTVDFGTKYQVNASDTAALIMHPYAMGTVKLLDLKSESDYDIRRQGTLMLSKMAVGHGILRPECIIELRKSA